MISSDPSPDRVMEKSSRDIKVELMTTKASKQRIWKKLCLMSNVWVM